MTQEKNKLIITRRDSYVKPALNLLHTHTGYMEIPKSLRSMEREHEVTIFVRLRFLNLYEAFTVFETQGDERGGFRFDFNATTFGFYVNDAMTSRIPFQWFPERLDVWYEISIEYSSILGRVKLYINGVLRETSSVFTTGVPLSVGSNMFISDKNDQDRRLSVLLGLFAMTEGLKADVGLGNPVDASYAAYAEFDTTATTIPDVSENGRHASFDEYRFGCDEEAEGPVSFDYHLYANTNYIKTSLDFGERMAIGYDVVGSTSVLRSLDLNSIGFDTNGGIENLQIQNVNSSEVYTFELWSHVDGEKIVDVADTCVADLAGNPNVRSNKLHWIRDTVPPVATLSSTALDDLSQEICESETTPSMCDSEKRIALDELNVVINFTEPVKHLSKDSFRLTGGKIKTLRMKSKTLYNATLDISSAQGTQCSSARILLSQNVSLSSLTSRISLKSHTCIAHLHDQKVTPTHTRSISKT